MTVDSDAELICDKLLAWTPSAWIPGPNGRVAVWQMNNAHRDETATPTFTTWSDAGYILEALRLKGVNVCLEAGSRSWCCVIEGTGYWAETAPLAIRIAAVGYLRQCEAAKP